VADVYMERWDSRLFTDVLVDLGDHENDAFRGVMSPFGEVGRKRLGVNATFLKKAESYYKKYQGFDYWRWALTEALTRIDVTEPKIIVEYGCGFGNATLPMLDIFPTSKVVASDISPNLLAILRRLLVSRGLNDRCTPIALDAHKSYIKDGCADLVFGAAILHHLVEPGKFIASALRVVKPGGSAVFFEPFEGGLAILRLILDEVIREANRRGVLNRFRIPFLVTKRLADKLRPQIFRSAIPGWRDLDDKWAFPRSVLEEIARGINADLQVYGLHDNVGQFKRHFSYLMSVNRFTRLSSFPSWVWDIFDRYDNETFSPEMLKDLAIEGCIIFTRRS
jgi:ubiquinone/menaquinone biosynthesis C-methylase UbiE